jgi:hypothetical protein
MTDKLMTHTKNGNCMLKIGYFSTGHSLSTVALVVLIMNNFIYLGSDSEPFRLDR